MPSSKTPKTQQVEHFKQSRTTSEFSVSTKRDFTLVPRNNFSCAGSIAKVSVLVKSIIPWIIITLLKTIMIIIRMMTMIIIILKILITKSIYSQNI